uniref:Uncharacterized protein n=1 Tax=Glossina pallidipes TaxID=7398 RepID=A0A1A9ZSJ1_GLOPL
MQIHYGIEKWQIRLQKIDPVYTMHLYLLRSSLEHQYIISILSICGNVGAIVINDDRQAHSNKTIASVFSRGYCVLLYIILVVVLTLSRTCAHNATKNMIFSPKRTSQMNTQNDIPTSNSSLNG